METDLKEKCKEIATLLKFLGWDNWYLCGDEKKFLPKQKKFNNFHNFHFTIYINEILKGKITLSGIDYDSKQFEHQKAFLIDIPEELCDIALNLLLYRAADRVKEEIEMKEYKERQKKIQSALDSKLKKIRSTIFNVDN